MRVACHRSTAIAAEVQVEPQLDSLAAELSAAAVRQKVVGAVAKDSAKIAALQGARGEGAAAMGA